MGNQQLCSLKTKQVILSGILGDSGIYTQSTKAPKKYHFQSSCIHKEYILFKEKYLSDYHTSIDYIEKNGFCNTPIYTLRTRVDKVFTILSTYSLERVCNEIDEFGLALFLYDDCSLHKKKLFYNICTHSFSKDEQEQFIIPMFNRFGIYPKLTIDRKKDGREFYYLRVSKYEGAYEMACIMRKIPLKCFEYKLWSSETIRNWSKLQVKLKSLGIVASYRRLSNLLKILDNGGTMQDIVQSLEKSKAGLTAVL